MAAHDDAPCILERLTPRERNVLHLIALGTHHRAISERLSISITTVRTHTQNILKKLGVHSKLEAVALAHRHDLVE
jgi:DNA-binding NarL/FixJ family response regulator